MPRGSAPGVLQKQAAAVVAKATAAALARVEAAGPSSYQMSANPAARAGAVSLPDALNAMVAQSGAAAVGKSVGDIVEQQLGYKFTPQERALMEKGPDHLLKLLEFEPKDLGKVFKGANAVEQLVKGKEPPPAQLLPKDFSLDDKSKWPNVPVSGDTRKPVDGVPGLHRGEAPGKVAPGEDRKDTVQRNAVMAETFQRLSMNAGVKEADKFSVTLGGEKHTSLDSFVDALGKAGYKVDAEVQTRVANFVSAQVAIPGTNPPQLADLAAPIMIRTGLTGEDGKPVVIPAMHSEVVFKISKDPDKKQNPGGLESGVRFFQGRDTTGFQPVNQMDVPKWLGMDVQQRFSGKDATEMMKDAGSLGQLIKSAAKDKGLANDGYADNGYCQDSVAVLTEMAIARQNGRTKNPTVSAKQFPLGHNDALMLPAIKAKLKQRNLSDAERNRLERMRGAYELLPNDDKVNDSTKFRVNGAVARVWAPGMAPFPTVEHAIRSTAR